MEEWVNSCAGLVYESGHCAHFRQIARYLVCCCSAQWDCGLDGRSETGPSRLDGP